MLSIDKAAFLQNVPLFAGMLPHELMDVAEIAREITYRAGTTIIHEDEVGDYMCVLVDGEVIVHRRNVQIVVLRPRDFFGEMSLLDSGPRTASVSTVSNCLLLKIDQKDFWDLLVNHNSLAVSMTRHLSQRLRQLLATALCS